MINNGIYEAMEDRFEKNHIKEDVEDVLLDMTEIEKGRR